jgi:hypothetical protein
MVLKGLEKNGYHDLAYDIARNCLENVVTVFQNDGTIYENYMPEQPSKGAPAKPNFVGWSGLFPISILFEYVFGIHPHAREEKIVWDIRLVEEHGVKNYPLGDLSVDLTCAERAGADEEPIITALCEKPIEIEVHYGDKVKTILATVKE